MNRLAFFGVAVASLIATSAHAAPDPYEVMRRRAPYHIQMTVSEVGSPSLAVAGRCLVTGVVAKVFRGRDNLVSEGRPVVLSLACRINNTPVPLDGEVWWQVERLEAAKVIEAFMDEGAEGLHLPADRAKSLRLLDAPTEQPVVRE